MASRGRKAPSKGNKGSSAVRKAPSAGTEGTPGAETKPMPGSASIPRTEFLRADSEMDGQNGFQTPPPAGTLTPLGPNGIPGTASQADASDIDGGSSVVGAAPTEDADLDDAEYKTWKQVTKKDRAMIAVERHRLFRNDHLNVEEPALLRTKAGMRRWLRQHKQALNEGVPEDEVEPADGKDGVQPASGETLAEGIEGEEERQVPDYYDTLSVMPELNERLKWVEDSEGQVIQQGEEFMRMMPKGYFQSPKSNLASKMEANMKQMQDTRKICAKIGIVKQMQLQSQVSHIDLLLRTNAYPVRPIKTSSKSTILNHLRRRMLVLWLYLMTVLSCHNGLVARPSSAASPKSSTMLALKNSSLRRWTLLPMLRATSSLRSPGVLTSIARRPRFDLSRAFRHGNPDSPVKRLSCTHFAKMVLILKRWIPTSRKMWSGWDPSWVSCTSA